MIMALISIAMMIPMNIEYSEIANDAKYGYKGKRQIPSEGGSYGENSGGNDKQILGGRHIFESLSSATSLEFLTDAGEEIGRAHV